MTRPATISRHLRLNYATLFFLFSSLLAAAILQEALGDDHVEDRTSWNNTWEDKLKQKLLAKYDKFARPTQHWWNTTHVNLTLTVFTVNVDDTTDVMAVNLWCSMTWNDDKLKWNSSEFGGLKQINLGSHELWIPDVHLLNSAAHGVEFYGDRHAVLNENGTALWVIPAIYHGYCNLDFTFWPFEMNICRLNLASWTYDGNQVDLKLFDDEASLYIGDYQPTGEWVVKNITKKRHLVYYTCCPEPYITLEFEFKLTRSSDLYYHVVFVPIIPIVFLMLLTFWMRPQSETKLVINAAVIFIVILYLMYFGIKIPPRSDSMPIIVRFYTGCLYQATISLLISTLLINIHKLAYYVSIPRTVRHLLMGKAGQYLGLGQIVQEIESQKPELSQEMSDDHLVEISMSTTSLNNTEQLIPSASKRKPDKLEWTLVATAIDRLVFILFCLIFIIMALICVRGKRSKFTRDN